MGEAKRRKQLDKNFGKDQIEDLKIISAEKFLSDKKKKLEEDETVSQNEIDFFMTSPHLILFGFKYKNQEQAGVYIIYDNLKQVFRNKQRYR